MKETVLGSKDYRRSYRPWADNLINSQPAVTIFKNVQSDRQALINITTLFRPPLDEMTADLDLPVTRRHTEQDSVQLVASFEASQLGSVALNSVIYNYSVVLNLRSNDWPVRYGDADSRKLDQLIKKEHLRARAEGLVIRTSAAILEHTVHRVPIGNIPEQAFEWDIEDSELRERTKRALRRADILTFGDLGILSINQLMKIPDLGKESVSDIKREFSKMGWLPPAHRQD